MSDRVLLTTLSIRTSKGGRRYYVGYLAKAKLLGFPAAEPDKFGNEQIELFVVEPDQRGPQSPAAKPPERDTVPARMSARGRKLLYARQICTQETSQTERG
jgi:hypothetical protein